MKTVSEVRSLPSLQENCSINLLTTLFNNCASSLQQLLSHCFYSILLFHCATSIYVAQFLVRFRSVDYRSRHDDHNDDAVDSVDLAH